jgi:NTP pyrophosphatase (non-canonical NTP hydrolase)
MRPRGERQIDAAIPHAYAAALRNGHKKHWRMEQLRDLFENLHKECDELERAIVDENEERVLEEMGDVIWNAVMIVDHDRLLGPWEGEEQ